MCRARVGSAGSRFSLGCAGIIETRQVIQSSPNGIATKHRQPLRRLTTIHIQMGFCESHPMLDALRRAASTAPGAISH